jgi:hypothetical protein
MQVLWCYNTVTEVKHVKICKCCTFKGRHIIFFNLKNLETFMETAICIIVHTNCTQYRMYIFCFKYCVLENCSNSNSEGVNLF